MKLAVAGKGQRSRTDATRRLRGINGLPAGVIIYPIWALRVGIEGFGKWGELCTCTCFIRILPSYSTL